MAFNYSGDPSTSTLDYLRFMLGDIDADTALFQDAELQYIIDTYEAANKQLAIAFRQAATLLGFKTVKRQLGPQSEDATARLAYYNSQAKIYEKAAQYSNTPSLPEYASEPVFGKDMMANET